MSDPCAGVGKTGPLTSAELETLWESVTDRSYWEPFTELGEGLGFEAHTQSFAQHARVSQAVDETTQGLYVLPWSGQTGEPAGGSAKSTVALSFSRTADFLQEVTLVPGTLVEEVAVDFGELGGVEVRTGRRYALSALAGLGPGVAGPVSVQAVAEAPGTGYDNPQPGTLVSVVQPGSGLANSGASVIPGILGHALVVDPDPDVVVPELVGQYVELVAGANAGAVRRVTAYRPANPGIDGGAVTLAPTTVLRFAPGSPTGTFASGEVVEQAGIWSATVLYATATHLVVDRLSGAVVADGATTASGVGSGATATFDSVDQAPDLAAETGTASWKVLDWSQDLGVSVTNAASPSGGQLAVLDELGAERRVLRGSGQDDDAYREKVSTLADVVSPNAVLRAINRVLGPLGLTGWLREVGLAGLPGLYYDGDPTSADPTIAFAYDLWFDGSPAQITSAAGSYPASFFGGEHLNFAIDGVAYTAFFQAGDSTQAQVIRRLNLAAGFNAFSDAGGGKTLFAGADVGSSATVQIVSRFPFTVSTVTGFTPTGVVAGDDTPVRPQDRYKLALSYLEMRAFFLVGLPALDLGDFGCAYDDGASNAYDAGPLPTAFYDGFALTAATLYRTIWQSLNEVRAGGVGFDLVLDPYGPL